VFELVGVARVHEVRSGHVGVDEHGHVEAGERRRAQRFGEGRRSEHPHAEAAVFFGDAQAEHAEFAHLAEDVAGDLAGIFPGVAVRGDFLAH